MTANKLNDNIETQIIQAARELFIEKGFVETSMSDIAAKVGINRPALHYYFRTKERMFQAVFGSIVDALVPRVAGIVLQQKLPIENRIEKLVSIYYEVFKSHPFLPLFMVREMNRDFDFVVRNVKERKIDAYALAIKQSLQSEMEKGKLKKLPVRFVLLTFYSLITAPFNTKKLCENLLIEENEDYDTLLEGWKAHTVGMLSHLLQPTTPKTL